MTCTLEKSHAPTSILLCMVLAFILSTLQGCGGQNDATPTKHVFGSANCPNYTDCIKNVQGQLHQQMSVLNQTLAATGAKFANQTAAYHPAAAPDTHYMNAAGMQALQDIQAKQVAAQAVLKSMPKNASYEEVLAATNKLVQQHFGAAAAGTGAALPVFDPPALAAPQQSGGVGANSAAHFMNYSRLYSISDATEKTGTSLASASGIAISGAVVVGLVVFVVVIRRSQSARSEEILIDLEAEAMD